MKKRKPMSEETKRKISLSMRKIFSPPVRSEECNKKMVVGYILEYIKYKNKGIESDINGALYINSRWEYLDWDQMYSTKDITIFEFQQRLEM